MSAGSLPFDRQTDEYTDAYTAPDSHRTGARDSLGWQMLKALGSLKITVVMFLAAVFLLFIGTLVQDEKNLPDVKTEYFNSWIAIVRLADFLPVTIFQDPWWRKIPGWFPFPGGGTIGLVLLVNLIAAKITRFHVAAKGSRLAWGVVVSILGGLLTLGVILTGRAGEGLQGQPPVSYQTVWRLVQLGAVALAIGLGLAAADGRQRRIVRAVVGIAAAVAGVVALLTIVGGEAWRMNDPGLRIMWQLIQSSVASLALLAGLVLVFGGRGGNVLIHVAVGLLMIGQFVFGDRQIEERMSLLEGQTTNVAWRTDEVELAVIDTGREDDDRVTAISGRLLQARAGGEPVAADGLPFSIRVLDYYPNSSMLRVGPVAPNRATTGLGRSWLADRRPPEGGASSQPNVASAYIQLVATEGGADLGTFLVSQWLNDFSQLNLTTAADQCDDVSAAGTTWRLQLRFRREYKPYSVALTDVRRINYSASETPRDYSSYVTFTDTETKAEQQGRIWMNNPVRYRGETFYQSEYAAVDLGGGRQGEMTGLQVVTNAGWLIPYVACVLAFWGMLVHFGGTFLRFADRFERQPAAAPVETGRSRRGRARHEPAPQTGRSLWPAALALGLVGACVLGSLPRGPRAGSADWRAAGSLPVMHEGRIKPLDSVARTTLQLLGNRTEVKMPAKPAAAPEDPVGSVPATRWLLGLMAGSEWVERAPVFRIDAKEVLDLFDVERRKSHRYSHAELEKGRPQLREQVAKLRDVPPESRTFVQKKLIEIEQKFAAYDLIRFAYEAPALPEIDPAADRQQVVSEIRRMMDRARLIEDRKPPAIIPPGAGPAAVAEGMKAEAGDWQSLYPAVMEAFARRVTAINPAILPLTNLLSAQTSGPADIDRAVADYRAAIASLDPVRVKARMVDFEAWFLAFNPIDLAKWLYILAAGVCFYSFLFFASFPGWHAALNRFVFWLLVGLLCLHTFAIGARIAITGRPPVVNLYGSAVFIGWACVFAGLVLERLFRLGIGNLVAAEAGALSLKIAYGLDSGDTMHVLQAVLDTQFWLSTHVVTVTLGYGATFLAGLLGTCAIVHGIVTRWQPGDTAANRRFADALYRMTYGVTCFALFFSFIGTVLGGLWADDSWGRFWGWDPKENGALMIVLWNAAVLHARWDRWLGPRGFALFTIAGNIVTAWSWFGTNQLSIGLHSYGFTSGVLLLLGAYVLSQLALIVAGLLLTRPPAASARTG